ncbi:unnamed protein product [Ilex paraguariensis]|uniref:Uncharacterized protein n=1 Tax=Ilex paraguariensis TaxID=185542 RepID=A0ABC8S4Z3_9AQUA
MTGEALTSKDPKKINGAPTCSTNYQAINEIDVEIEDHHNIQEFPTLPTGNNVRDSSPVPTVGGSSNGQHPSKHMSVPQTKPTPTKPWSQVLKQNAMKKSSSLTVESWKPKPAPLQASSDRLDNGKAIATMTGLEQQEAGQTQVEELIGGYQASSLVTVKNNMGMVIQGGASTSSQQEILGHDHHITKITVNESTPPQLLMQAGVTLASNKFEELNKEGANCG